MTYGQFQRLKAIVTELGKLRDEMGDKESGRASIVAAHSTLAWLVANTRPRMKKLLALRRTK